MKLLRNVVWGILSAAWFTTLVLAGITLLALFSRAARANIAEDLAEMGGISLLLGGYAIATGLCGVTLGALRFLTQTPVGIRLLGGILATEAFSVVLAVAAGDQFSQNVLQSQVTIIVFVGGTFLVGALMAPLFASAVRSGSIWMPNFDGWLSGLCPTSEDRSPPSSSGDGEGAA